MIDFLERKILSCQRFILDTIVRNVPNLGLPERAEYFVKAFEQQLPGGSRVLDIGGGWGFYHEPLVKRGHQHIVLDVVKPGIQNAPVVVYDGKRIPFPDKSFDVSLLITVLHHIPDPEHTLKEARRVTRGRIVVVEDLFHHRLGGWWTCLRDQLYNFEFLGHAGQFKKKKDWISLFAKNGMPIIFEREMYTWLSGMRILNGVMVFDVQGL